MQKHRLLTVMLSCIIISACTAMDSYSIHHGPYDRNKICDVVNRQLMYYDDPNYYSAHPISQAKLDEIYEVYKVNGCDK